MLAENRIGIFFYHKGKRAASAVAGEDLKTTARSFPGVEVVEDLYQDHWETGIEALTKEIADQALSRLIVVTQQGTPEAQPGLQAFSRWGFRPDQVAVVDVRPDFMGVESEPELIRERSALLLKQAVVRQGALEAAVLESVETIPRILILGGGLAGLLAAQEALKLGLAPLVLESGKTLGPSGYYEQADRPAGASIPVENFISQPGVQAVPEALLVSLAGQAGDFTVRFLDGEDRVREEKVGAVLVALPPEGRPNFEAYGLKAGRKVLPLSQLETLLSSPEYREKILPAEEVGEVVFLLGLASESGPPVVGRAIRDALRVQALGNTQVYFFSGNLKVAAEGLEREYARAREEGVVFFRFTGGSPVVEAGDAGLRLEFDDEILGRRLQLKPHLLVVDETLAPHPKLKEYAEILGLGLDSSGFMVPDQVYALPVRTPRRGIYVVGGSRRPYVTADEIQTEVEEAVLSAAELIGGGMRQVPASRVEVDRKKCTICLTCVRSCPHQALHFVYRRPQASPLACQACGVCAAECPMDAIQIKDFRDETIQKEISGNFRERKYDSAVPQVVAFCCRNSAEKTIRQAVLFREPLPIGFEFIQVPCAGKIDPDQVLQAFREGADGVLLLACPLEGCQSFEGNKKAWERVQYLREVLVELGLEPERLLFETVGPGMTAQLIKTLLAVDDRIRKLGFSPVRRARGIQRVYDQFTFPVDSKTFVI
ncbi:MAG: hydrogenase iron-sulfur subunit [Deltaproteobacteria bacterium]|nr:hydrogenase iron-sulfur subunit [Deltaproteobacteria bacterium]